MFSAQRPPLMRSRLEAIFATTCGVTMPGCTATMSSMRLVTMASAEASTQAEKIGAEEALGDQRGVEAELVGAADCVACEFERPVLAAREARACFDLREGVIHARFRPDGVRQRSPDSKFHRLSRHE